MKTVKRVRQSALVEWQEEEGGALKRAWVPSSEADSPEAASLGIEYGVPWAEIVSPISVSPEMIEAELRRRGIWTAQDAQANPQAVMGAIMALIGVDMSAVIKAARRYEKEQGNGR